MNREEPKVDVDSRITSNGRRAEKKEILLLNIPIMQLGTFYCLDMYVTDFAGFMLSQRTSGPFAAANIAKVLRHQHTV